MSEKIYALLLKLYPEHFRREYGDEAMRLVHDRARSEKGFLSGLRLWLDLLADFAISLPREYSKEPATPIAAAQEVKRLGVIGAGQMVFSEKMLLPPRSHYLIC